MTIIIDGIEYVPKAEVKPITDVRLKMALQHLTEIQYFSNQTHKHRAWAWDALDALAPELSTLPAKEAYHAVRSED